MSSREGLVNKIDNPSIDEDDVGLELGEGFFPSGLMLNVEHIEAESFKFSDFVLNFFIFSVDFIGATGDLSKVWTEGSIKLLDDFACFLNIIKDVLHVTWCLENLSGFLEVPSFDGLLVLDGTLCLVEFLSPGFEDGLAFSDDDDGLIWLFENLGDINLSLDHFADFSGDAFKNIFHL